MQLESIIEGKRICVTGGSGFIGSNIVQVLAKKNDVIVIDSLLTGRRSNLENIECKFIEGSVNDAEKLRHAFLGVDYVLHQAALASVPRSIDDPMSSNLNNVEGTLNVLMMARKCNVKKVVFASSSSVYGDTPTLPKVETMAPNPQSPYAVTKIAAEQYCQVFWKNYKLPTAALRYFNAFGPRQDPNMQYAAVIPKFIQLTKAGKKLVVYGDGEQTRDFTYIMDVVQANLRAAVDTESNGEVFNIARQESISLNGLAKMIFDQLGKKGQMEYLPERAGDIKHSLADITKAKTLLGYKPEYTIEQGVGLTIASM
ncbi:MAG: SDR family oxidoreductase [Methanomassiliicoccales archaeon]|jgi:nucleoside-diphosphate-sugar epimerase